MYVIARREQESILLHGGLVRIRVLSVTGKIVRLGFDAPPEVDISREEVTLEHKEESSASNTNEETPHD